VKPNYNQYDKLVDFRINEIPFDHKTSVFPKAYPKTLEEALENKEELIRWFYKNQSQEGRKHFKNRIFLVLYNKENVNEHWKLKTEILYIKTIIEKYVSVYNSDNLVKLNLNGEEVWSDIIWIIK
jgi:septum formation topological specificity factor MinE